MGWTKIDRAAWAREAFFRHYHDDVPCFYSMIVSLDVTRLRAAGLKLYPAMLHALATVVNRHEELRTAMVDGEVGVYDIALLHGVPPGNGDVFQSLDDIQRGLRRVSRGL